MELTLVPILLPVIQSTFDVSISELAWVFNSYGIAVALGVLVGGLLGDRFEPKKVFAAGVLAFAFGSIMVAVAPSFEVILAGRVLQGFGGGVFSPLIPIILTQASPERPGKVLIMWGSIAGYIAAFAPIVFGTLFSDANWRMAFVAFAVISFVAMLVVQLSNVARPQIENVRPHNALGQILRSVRLWLMYGYVFCTYGCITYFLFRMPLWLEENQFSLLMIGLVLSAMWFSFSVFGTVLRNKVDQPFVRTILVFAPVFIALGFQLAQYCNSAVCIVLSSVFVGCGFACSNAPSTQLILRLAPRGSSALSASLDITFARLGGVCAVALLAPFQFDTSIFTTLVLCVVGALFAYWATRKREPELA